MNSNTLIERERRNAESWKEEAERVQEQAQRVRVLCRATTYAGEALEQEDHEILFSLIDEMLREIGGRAKDLNRLFGNIERVGPHSITLKKREAA